MPSVFKWKPKVSDTRSERVAARNQQKETTIRKTSDQCQFNSSVDCPSIESRPFGPLTLDDYVKQQQQELEQLRSELTRAKEREALSKFGLDRFLGSKEDINFYTGFPDSQTLLELWKYIESDASDLTYYSYVRDTTEPSSEDTFPFLNKMSRKYPGSNVGGKRILKPVDEFWLVLTRLRLGLFERAHRFNVSLSTISDIMITWINLLFVVLGGFPTWASRESIKQHLPEAFKGKFENVKCIIDCTEIKVQTPMCLEKQSELYSEYKSHNTYKGLVGISPNAWVTFVSHLYGGNISDREIVEKSHFVDLLEPPDLIMADRGFEIQDFLASKRVKIYIPPKQQSAQDQFSKEECFETMRIANLRIHIERAIRRVKGWHIFDQVLPLSMNGIVNQMWAVCCILVNWQNPALTS